MPFGEFVWYIIAVIIIFGAGFVIGGFTKAWNISRVPIVGKIIIDGDELYLSLDGVVDLNELRKHGEVTVNVVDVKTRRKNSG